MKKICTKEVNIGGVKIGGKNKIALQSMTNTDTADVEKTVKQINELSNIGADLVRCSIPNEESAVALFNIKKHVSVPIIADIHFNYKLAMLAIENGADKIRLNPSNFPQIHLAEVVDACRDKNIPIRIGINQGSVNAKESEFSTKSKADSFCYGKYLSELCLDSAEKILACGYDNLVLAVKSSSVIHTISAYKYLAKKTMFPLHIGLTESGTLKMGKIKSAVAIGSLLADGIGNTLRVSLTADPKEEIIFAKELLRAVGEDKNYCHIISCPTCARTEFDVIAMAEKLETVTQNITTPLKIAVMGCVVNGVGEGKDADIGIAGGKEKTAFFCNGKILKYVDNADIEKELLILIERYISSGVSK